MHRRYESMSARNGDVDSVNQQADSGIGVRALVGSGWGFFATADLADRTGADELMLTTMVHSHAERLRSYELVAEVMELPAA